MLTQPDYDDVDVSFYFEKKPETVLARTKVFLSIQKYENYPSHSLLEAICSGMLPIVTDIGESKEMFKNEDIIRYISTPLSVVELGEAIEEILNYDMDVYEKNSQIISAFIKERFSTETHVHYFLSLYQ